MTNNAIIFVFFILSGLTCRLKADRAALKAQLREEVEAKDILQMRCLREKEHFTREYSQFESRLRLANTMLEKNRLHVEASLHAKDMQIDKLQRELALQQSVLDSYQQKHASSLYDDVRLLKDTQISNQVVADVLK
jgi:hypothetical protein